MKTRYPDYSDVLYVEMIKELNEEKRKIKLRLIEIDDKIALYEKKIEEVRGDR